MKIVIMPGRNRSEDGCRWRARSFQGFWTNYGEPFYSASFAADGEGVAVKRGDAPGSLEREEEGSYRLDEEGALCLGGVLHLVDECFTLVPSPNGFDLVRGKSRVLATVTRLE